MAQNMQYVQEPINIFSASIYEGSSICNANVPVLTNLKIIGMVTLRGTVKKFVDTFNYSLIF